MWAKGLSGYRSVRPRILVHFDALGPKKVIDTARDKSAVEIFGELSRRAAVEPQVANVLFDAGRSLGQVLGVATPLLDPSSFIMTGMVTEDDHYMAGVKHSLAVVSRRHQPSSASDTPHQFAVHVRAHAACLRALYIKQSRDRLRRLIDHRETSLLEVALSGELHRLLDPWC